MKTAIRSHALAMLIFASLFCVTRSHAADVALLNEVVTNSQQGTVYDLMSSTAIAGNGGTASSGALDLSRGLYFGLWLKCAGSADVKAEWFESPTKEATDFVSVQTIVANHTSAGTNPNIYSVSPPPMRYGRLKLTGNAGNGAGATCTAKILLWATRD